jgi:hypothetical protein
MYVTYSRAPVRHGSGVATSGAGYCSRVTKLVLIASIASVALSGGLLAAPVGNQLATRSADQLQHVVAAKKKKPAASVKLQCPPRFTAACLKYQRSVCVQNDSRGCCTKSICQ